MEENPFMIMRTVGCSQIYDLIHIQGRIITKEN